MTAVTIEICDATAKENAEFNEEDAAQESLRMRSKN